MILARVARLILAWGDSTAFVMGMKGETVLCSPPIRGYGATVRDRGVGGISLGRPFYSLSCEVAQPLADLRPVRLRCERESVVVVSAG